MKNDVRKIVIFLMLLVNSFSYAETLDDALKISIEAFKDQIYEALKDDKNIGPHIPKTEQQLNTEMLQICKFWLDQYSRSVTEMNEKKTVESCTAAGIDMSKYQK